MWVCYALSVLKPLLRKPEMTIYNSGDTNSNEIEFVPAAIIVRSAGISKSVLNDPRGWATANGIRWRCFGGQVYFAVLDIDAWRPEVKPAQTMKPEPVKVVASVPEGCVTIPAAELAMLRSRLSSLDNSLLLINDHIRRTSEPDEADRTRQAIRLVGDLDEQSFNTTRTSGRPAKTERQPRQILADRYRSRARMCILRAQVKVWFSGSARQMETIHRPSDRAMD